MSCPDPSAQSFINPLDDPYIASPLWLVRHAPRDLNHRAVMVYSLLASRHSELRGCAWPSQASIADDLGVSERTVTRVLAELVRLGLIEVTQRGHHRSNEYRFPHHPWMDGDVYPDPPGSTQSSEGSHLMAGPNGISTSEHLEEQLPHGNPGHAKKPKVRPVESEFGDDQAQDDDSPVLGAARPERPVVRVVEQPGSPTRVKRRAPANTKFAPRDPDDPETWNAGNLGWYFGRECTARAARQEIVGFAGFGNEAIVATEVKKWMAAGMQPEEVKEAMDYFFDHLPNFCQPGWKPAKAFVRSAAIIRSTIIEQQQIDSSYNKEWRQEW